MSSFGIYDVIGLIDDVKIVQNPSQNGLEESQLSEITFFSYSTKLIILVSAPKIAKKVISQFYLVTFLVSKKTFKNIFTVASSGSHC